MNITKHAERAAANRGIDVNDVVSIAVERLDGQRYRFGAAVLVGFCEDVARGFSNGDEVWAIVRGDELTTVFYRRHGQPKTKAALQVERVIA